jgi:hypothetical protein
LANWRDRLRRWLYSGTDDPWDALNSLGPNSLSSSTIGPASYPIAVGSVPNELFLSHSSQDRPFADRLAAVLRKHGVPVWYSTERLLGAQQWHDEIGKALERCDWFIVVLSPASVESPWVKRELLYALREPKFEGHIIPILQRPCNEKGLSWVLPGFQRIDFTQAHESSFRNLLRIWGIGYDNTV